MKLKKIASLALAGVMAISMLAGCSGKTENNENNGDQNQVVAASVADYANSLLSSAQKNVFEFENSSDLTAALKKVASDSTKFGSTKIEKISNELTNLALGQLVNTDLASELKDEMKLDVEAGKGLNSVAKEGDRTQGFVYAVSGKLTEASAVQLVVKGFADEAMKDGDYFPAKVGNFKCDYTAEISAVKVTAPDTDKNSAWVVAIVVTQDAVKVSNT